MAVYVIQDSLTKNIKIGFTNGAIRKRLQALQTGCSGELQLIYLAVDGDRQLEKWLHYEVVNHRVKNEWFSSDALLSVAGCLFYGLFTVKTTRFTKVELHPTYPYPLRAWTYYYLFKRRVKKNAEPGYGTGTQSMSNQVGE